MRTRCSAAMARSRSAPPEAVRSCARIASVIWSPTVNTGFRLVIGSWKIIAMRLPRMSRICAGDRSSRFLPSNMICPAAMRPGGGTSRITDSASTDLPQPDSPTMPSVRPRSTEMSTPSTATTSPPAVRNTVRRPETANSAPSPLAGEGCGRGGSPLPPTANCSERRSCSAERRRRDLLRRAVIPVEVRHVGLHALLRLVQRRRRPPDSRSSIHVHPRPPSVHPHNTLRTARSPAA